MFILHSELIEIISVSHRGDTPWAQSNTVAAVFNHFACYMEIIVEI